MADSADPSDTPCPVCQVGHTAFLFAKGNYPIRQCEVCKFLFVHPPPTERQLFEYYNNAYRDASAENYPKAGSRKRRAFGRALRLAPFLWGRSVIELGCGGGFMTWAMSKFANRTVGVDISRGSIEYAIAHFPRSEFRCESLAWTATRGEKFDLVFSSELFEHVSGVDEIMICIRALTRSGSFVYVSTPDATHTRRPPLAEWEDICPPEHLQWFGRDNLSTLFERYGFRPYRFLPSRTPAHSAFFLRE